ncbi:DUF6891 domain-containing protein [Pseudomonas quasicaspiana]|uniref:DUF6891 domain-containing protein n=1 Tax=Pseudomonas quasicaspiana TaxID=2829821 RepID=UPI001E2DDD3F|nr:hypothetical protein [Pseudomonas quasicaspiana]
MTDACKDVQFLLADQSPETTVSVLIVYAGEVPMADSNEYVADSIRMWVSSGFYTAEEMHAMVDDIVDGDCDVPALKALILPELQRKLDAERNWPQVTACDRLDDVFYHLHEDGICALQNAGYETSDGFTEVAEALDEAPDDHYHGFCFYHGQDVECVIKSDVLYIAFGAISDDPAQALKVGQRLATVLKTAGFEIVWNETVERCVEVHNFKWQRRSPVTDSGLDALSTLH